MCVYTYANNNETYFHLKNWGSVAEYIYRWLVQCLVGALSVLIRLNVVTTPRLVSVSFVVIPMYDYMDMKSNIYVSFFMS
jgi:hypothetical protein